MLSILKSFFYSLVVCCLVVCCLMVVSSYAGTITTQIVSTYEIEGAGKIRFDIDVFNKGDETAYQVEVVFFFGGSQKRFTSLGDNPPNQKINVSTKYHYPEMLQGNYIGVISAEFKELNGITHKATHVFLVQYKTDEAVMIDSRINLSFTNPFKQQELVVDQDGALSYLLKNNHESQVRVQVYFHLSEGLATDNIVKVYELSQGEELRDQIIITSDRKILQNTSCNVVVGYELDNVAYAQHIPILLSVSKKPMLLKWYIIVCITFLLCFFVILYTKNLLGKIPPHLYEE